MSRSIVVWAALLALLALSVTTSLMPLGVMRSPLNFLIASAMALLIMIHHMRLDAGSTLVRIVSIAGFFGLALLFALGFADDLTRI